MGHPKQMSITYIHTFFGTCYLSVRSIGLEKPKGVLGNKARTASTIPSYMYTAAPGLQAPNRVVDLEASPILVAHKQSRVGFGFGWTNLVGIQGNLAWILQSGQV